MIFIVGADNNMQYKGMADMMEMAVIDSIGIESISRYGEAIKSPH